MRTAPGATGKPWTRYEINECVNAYLEMLRSEHRGERYSKVDVVRRLGGLLAARSPAAIERKFQNVSAILEQIGQPWIDGYKPLQHFQGDLRSAVLTEFRRDHRLAEELADYSVNALAAAQPRRVATEDVTVPPPHAYRDRRSGTSVQLTGGAISALRDYQMKRLGTAGEAWVVELEREQLKRAGRIDLSTRVRWVARDVGDGMGYDVASFHPDGRERLIEVKTTNYGVKTPFYVTRWELEYSVHRPDAYSLYRVHGFARDPRVYILEGSIADAARLEPAVFLGVPN